MLACDREGRILSAGRGVFELTGFPEGDLMGEDLREALAGRPRRARTPSGRCSSGASARSTSRCLIRHSVGHDKRVRCDFFPAYDEDGGLLCSLAPLIVAEPRTAPV